MSHLFLARPISALLRGIELSGEEGTARLREILNRYPDPALRAFRGQEIELIAHSFTRANDGEFTPVRTILWRGRL